MKVAVFDGGGIKGLIPLLYIKNILKVYPKFLENVDFIAGTSTGGIIALLFAYGYSIDEIIDFYVNKGKDIFSDSIFDDVKDLFGLEGAQYSQNNLKVILQNKFGNATLGELKKKLLITSFCLDNNASIDRSWEPKIYDNFDDKYKNELLWELALRSSAAPTYFPTFNKFCDGGIFANSLGMCCISELYKNKYKDEDIKMISFGIGDFKKYIPGINHDWGLLKWAPNLIDIMMEGNSQLVNYQCKACLDENYLRINPDMVQEFKLDGVKQIPEMIKCMSDCPIEGNVVEFLENIWLK